MAENQPKPESKPPHPGVRDLILSNYFATIGSRGGKAASRADKVRCGKLGAQVRWANYRRQQKSRKKR
jgi:hypothetical protein